MPTQYTDYSPQLAQFPIFKRLPQSELQAIPVVKPPRIRQGTTIFKQDSPITRVFMVLSGEVELVRYKPDGSRYLTRIVKPGQVFGRLELDTGEGQLGTATATKPTDVLYVDKDVLGHLRNRYRNMRDQLDRSAVIGHLRAIPYFAPLSDLEIKWISDIVTVDSKPENTWLYARGDPGDSVLIVRQGRVRLESGREADNRWVSAGTVLGDRSAVEGRRRLSSAITESECRYYVLGAEDLRQVTSQHPDDVWIGDPFNVERLLKQAPLFHKLLPEEIRHLAGYTMQLHYGKAHYAVTRQYKPDNYYYILINGTATSVTTNKEGAVESMATLQPGSCFGAGSVLLGEASTATVETVTITDWLRIHRIDFRLFLLAHPGAEERLTMEDALRERLRGAAQMRDWQQEGEIILWRTRRHWIVLIRNLGIVFGAYFLLILCNLAVSAFLAVPVGLQWLRPIVVLCLPMPVAIWVILDYLNDYHIVTSRRIVHEEKVILFSEKRTSAPLDKVQDQRVDRSFWAQIFGYGHLIISTAAERGQILFDFLPHVYDVMDLINEEAAKAKAGIVAENEETIRTQIQDRLHLGLEERTDERALVEEIQQAPKAAKSRKTRNPFKRFMGLQERPGNRLVWRKHWLGLVVTTFVPLLLTGGSAVLLTLIARDTILNQVSPQLRTIFVAFSFILLLFGIGWLWWDWTDWVNDRYILTDQYIEHIEKKPLFFDEQRQITTFERVQNVEFEKPNPIYYLFDFGNVYIQTAATEGLVQFRYVPEPDFIQAEIYRRIERYEETQAQMRRAQTKNEMIDWLDAYHKLVNQENQLHSGS